MKQCAHCRESKPLDAYSNNRSKKDGKQLWCKSCVSHRNALLNQLRLAYLNLYALPNEGNKDTAIRLFASTPMGLLRWLEVLPAMTRVEGECYIWEGSSYGGYAKWNVPVATTPLTFQSASAHRVAYAVLVGDLPLGRARDSEDEVLDHLCGNSLCVNASHLRIDTLGSNSSKQGQVRQAPSYKDAKLVARFDGRQWVA